MGELIFRVLYRWRRM